MSSQAVYINKKTGTEALSFQAFVDEGLDSLQKLSGHIWTDYNTHDPGVTILEQLCFALSDHIYKNSFSVEDYLLGNASNIDLDELSLHVSNEIFALHPSTNEDLRTHLLHTFSELENINIVQAQSDSVSTDLLDMYIAVDSMTGPSKLEPQQLTARIEKAFSAHRSLNQLINKVEFTKPVKIQISANIVVKSAANCSQVLAMIYFEIQKHIQIIQVQESKRLAQTPHAQLVTHTIDVSELFEAISNIEYVSAISKLAFINEDGVKTNSIQFDLLKQSLKLTLPHRKDDFGIQLYLGNRALGINFGHFSTELSKQISLFAQTKQQRQKIQQNSIEQSKHLDTAINRDLSDYIGLSAFFPTNYKLRKGELLSTDSEAIHVANSQFKGYLAIYDQLLCDQAQSLAHISNLFSPTSCITDHGEIDLSHFICSASPITEDNIAGLSLFTEPNYPEHVKKIQKSHNKFFQRASKIADYFLALYGEKLNQRSLSTMYAWQNALSVDEQILTNKIKMLQHIKCVTKNRLKAENLLLDEKGVEDISGLELKLSLLLGLDICKHRELKGLTLNQTGMHIIEHGVLGKSILKSDLSDTNMPTNLFSHQITIVLPSWTRLTRQVEFRELAHESVMLSTPAHIYPHLVFLNRQKMENLEHHLMPWLQSFRHKNTDSEINTYALALAQYLYSLLPAYKASNNIQDGFE